MRSLAVTKEMKESAGSVVLQSRHSRPRGGSAYSSFLAAATAGASLAADPTEEEEDSVGRTRRRAPRMPPVARR